MSYSDIDLNIAELAKNYTVLDDGSQRITQVYSAALYQSALPLGLADSVLEELFEIASLLKKNPKLEAFFSIPVISRDEKTRLVKLVFEGKCSPLVMNFIFVLNEHDRLGLLSATVHAYQILNETRKNQLQVQVITSVEVTPEQDVALLKALQVKLGKQPVLSYTVDDSIVGGLIIKAGDWLWDGSLRSRLQSLRNQLIERSTYEIQSRRDSFSSSEGN
jgi:F-type H+-transporting ATPase subunit delta